MSAASPNITPEWSDEDLIDYCSTHCKTERALFHRDHILRIWRLAGEPQSTNVHELPEWVAAHADSMMPLVQAARARLKPAGDPKPDAQATLRNLAIETVPIGIYVHRKGGEYVVFTHSLNESNLEPLVHYFSLHHGTRWTRTIVNFTEQVDGEPRFKRKRDATSLELHLARSALL